MDCIFFLLFILWPSRKEVTSWQNKTNDTDNHVQIEENHVLHVILFSYSKKNAVL